MVAVLVFTIALGLRLMDLDLYSTTDEGYWMQRSVRFGAALARVHGVPFFHADLKGFHVWIEPAAPDRALALRFLDFGRVGFRMSRRRRIINLYQALRFIVPDSPDAQERFVSGYCTAAGGDPARLLRATRRFLAHKLRTHPVVE